MTANRAMVIAGIATAFQAGGQILLTSLGLLQFFCYIDFLREFPLLIFIKILYFSNTCDQRINVGQAVEGVPNQAFVLLQRTTLPALRTFYINCASLGLAVLWLIASFGLMTGGAEKKETKSLRWPWIIITVLICGVDLVATVICINDTFHTRTLSELVDYVGGSMSGFGNVEVNTSWAAWMMTMIYSRFVIFFFLNLILIVAVVIVVKNKQILFENTGVVEAQTTTIDSVTLANNMEELSERSVSPPATMIPRPWLNQSFRWMKTRLFGRDLTLRRNHRLNSERLESGPQSLQNSPNRSPQAQHVPKRNNLENLIAEQRQRLDQAVVDTSGRRNAPGGVPQASQSQPNINTIPEDSSGTTRDAHGRRGTAVELQGQLPWAYIPAPVHHMREQLPPGEELPPVPLPDYTAIPSFRKTSVHRAASSLSSLNHQLGKKSRIPRPRFNSADVLY